MGADNVALLGTGAAASPAYFGRFERHTSFLDCRGAPRPGACPESARFKFGGGRHEGVHGAADTPLGIRSGRGEFTAFALVADIPSLLRKGAIGALGGQVDFACNVSTLSKRGGAIPLRFSGPAHYV